MSEEIINNENGNTEQVNNNEQTQSTTPAQSGSAAVQSLGAGFSGGGNITLPVNPVTPIENPIVVQQHAFEKIGREMRTKISYYNTDARNALAREVAEIACNKESLLTEKQELIDEFNREIHRIEAEIKALETDARNKSNIACTGELREEVLCDIYQTESEVIAVPEGESPENTSAVIARVQITTEQQETI